MIGLYHKARLDRLVHVAQDDGESVFHIWIYKRFTTRSRVGRMRYEHYICPADVRLKDWSVVEAKKGYQRIPGNKLTARIIRRLILRRLWEIKNGSPQDRTDVLAVW